METLPDLTERLRRSLAVKTLATYVKCQLLRIEIATLPDDDLGRRVKALASDDALRNAATQFLAVVTPATVLGRLRKWTTNAPPFVPVHTIDVDSVVGAFAGPGYPLPVSPLATTSTTDEIGRLGTIVPFDRRALQSADARAQAAYEAALVAAVALLEDKELLSTTVAVTGQRPAGLLAAAQSFDGTGGPDALANALADAAAYVSGGTAGHLVAIATPSIAVWLGAQTGGAFVDARLDSTGTVSGIPLLISSSAPLDALVVLDATQLVVTDDGVEIIAGSDAALEYATNPVNNSVTPTGAVLLSGFQNNVVHMRIARFLWWSLARPDAVATVTGKTVTQQSTRGRAA
jgi:hypothetical protein